MRRALADKDGERRKFQAVFCRLGSKSNYHGYAEETVLLRDIMDLETKFVVADHLWFSFSKSFQQAGLREGQKVEFEARIKKYIKGYVNKSYKIDQRTTDYKLSHPTKVKVVSD